MYNLIVFYHTSNHKLTKFTMSAIQLTILNVTIAHKNYIVYEWLAFGLIYEKCSIF